MAASANGPQHSYNKMGNGLFYLFHFSIKQSVTEPSQQIKRVIGLCILAISILNGMSARLPWGKANERISGSTPVSGKHGAGFRHLGA